MQNLKIDISKIFDLVPEKEITEYYKVASKQLKELHNKTGKGNEFLGWLDLPSSTSQNLLNDIENTAKELQKISDVVVIIGIGGSYLGAKSVINALSDNFNSLDKKRKTPLILYAGQNICEDYMSELLNILTNYSYSLVVISKSGTTTEPAIAFRLLKEHLEKKYNKTEIQKRIVTITDKEKGALRKLSDKEGFKSFIIPDNVGGRYSVLTPVGLLPIAIAGFDIRKIINGAKETEQLTGVKTNIENNPATIYAIARNALYQQGKNIEILVNYHSKLHFLSEWWKQLFGESEGKENKGIFPTSVSFTTDLHSLGQYIQEGTRNIFETVITINKPNNIVTIPNNKNDLDNLNYLSGLQLNEVNKKAGLGTSMAHVKGDVPNIKIEIPELNEFYIGQLIYFFEKACAISGYLLGVNPFDQPGVEEYKKNMFELLGKPNN